MVINSINHYHREIWYYYYYYYFCYLLFIIIAVIKIIKHKIKYNIIK